MVPDDEWEEVLSGLATGVDVYEQHGSRRAGEAARVLAGLSVAACGSELVNHLSKSSDPLMLGSDLKSCHYHYGVHEVDLDCSFAWMVSLRCLRWKWQVEAVQECRKVGELSIDASSSAQLVASRSVSYSPWL